MSRGKHIHCSEIEMFGMYVKWHKILDGSHLQHSQLMLLKNEWKNNFYLKYLLKSS